MANALKDERHRGNGFTFLRLVFALSVLYAHSFAFGPVPEPLWQLSNGTLAISGIAVDGFFVISGFLVWRSMRASAGPWTYLAKRGLRLLPALVAVMVLSVLLGALFTSLGPAEYWTHPQLWYFLSNPFWMLRGGVHFNLPGVFTELPVHAVNVSLWTIPYEIFFYLLLLLPVPCPAQREGAGPAAGDGVPPCLRHHTAGRVIHLPPYQFRVGPHRQAIAVLRRWGDHCAAGRGALVRPAVGLPIHPCCSCTGHCAV
jgi:peptidoglycan/LPS O-acetylase OafA/YrhL